MKWKDDIWVHTWEGGNLQQKQVVTQCHFCSEFSVDDNQQVNIEYTLIYTCLAMYSSASSTSYFTVLHLAAVISTRVAAWSAFIPCFTRCSCQWWYWHSHTSKNTKGGKDFYHITGLRTQFGMLCKSDLKKKINSIMQIYIKLKQICLTMSTILTHLEHINNSSIITNYIYIWHDTTSNVIFIKFIYFGKFLRLSCQNRPWSNSHR